MHPLRLRPGAHSPNSPRWLQSKLGRVQLRGTQSRQLVPSMSWKNSCTLCSRQGGGGNEAEGSEQVAGECVTLSPTWSQVNAQQCIYQPIQDGPTSMRSCSRSIRAFTVLSVCRRRRPPASANCCSSETKLSSSLLAASAEGGVAWMPMAADRPRRASSRWAARIVCIGESGGGGGGRGEREAAAGTLAAPVWAPARL